MNEQKEAPDKFIQWLNIAVSVSVAVIALLGSFITKIEGDASALADIAGNEEQKYYYDSIGTEINGAAEVNYAFGTVYQLWYQYNLQLTAAQKHDSVDAIKTYTDLRNSIAKTSRIFDPKYFNVDTGQVNLLRYKADRYGTLVYALQEKQRAASEVSSAWGDKSSLYVLQLTLLAVAGFLLGLALISQAKIPTFIFAASGMALVAFIALWAFMTYKTPVFDLRQTKAIGYFAQGSSLSDQKRWDEALDMLTKAIESAEPNYEYARAYLLRARVKTALGQFDSAVKDYQKASELGETDPTLNASLVLAYFRTGDFQNAISSGTEAVKFSPNDLWLQQQLNMAILAVGDMKKASDQYQKLLDIATEQTEKQRQLGGNPSQTWWLVDEAAFQLDELARLLKSETASPIKANIKDPKAIADKAVEIADLLRKHSIALQYNIEESSINSTAAFGTPNFTFAKTPDDKYVYSVDMKFSYRGMETGGMVIIKVYRNGIQDPSWSFDQKWTGSKKDGLVNFTISPAYNGSYIVPPGIYAVDIYLDGQRLQRGEFVVADPNNPEAGLTPDAFFTTDMLDQFDFYASDFSSISPDDADEDFSSDPLLFLNSDEDYLSFLNNAYDPTANDCTDPNDLACLTTEVECTDLSCEGAPSQVCESDPALSPDDPNCLFFTSQVCELDPTLSIDNPNCISPLVCESDPSLAADDPNCVNSIFTEAPTEAPIEVPTATPSEIPPTEAPTEEPATEVP